VATTTRRAAATKQRRALPTGPRPGGGWGRRRSRLTRLDLKLSPYLYISPFYLLFLAFGLFPLGYTLFVSLNRWNLIDAAGHKWVGLANYSRLLHDPFFWNALRNTFSMFLLSTVPQLLVALGLAHVLNARLRGKTFFRMGVLLPNVTSVAAVAIIFAQLFGRDFGMINWLLGLFGVHHIDWQSSRLASHGAISLMVFWRWTGYNALIYLAAMQSISSDLYEAASIDGATGFQQFRKITIPSLRPAIIFTVIISTIGGLQLFTEPLLFDNLPGSYTGGSDRQFQTVTQYLYEQGFRFFRFGYAATIAWVLFLVIVLVSLVNYALVRRISSSR
jgi:cellobiose transport system permease protein